MVRRGRAGRDLLAWASAARGGRRAIAFPLIVAVYWGILLLRDTAREERVRMFIGFSVLGLGVLGLLSLLGGNPGPTRRLRRGRRTPAA